MRAVREDVLTARHRHLKKDAMELAGLSAEEVALPKWQKPQMMAIIIINTAVAIAGVVAIALDAEDALEDVLVVEDLVEDVEALVEVLALELAQMVVVIPALEIAKDTAKELVAMDA
jgi:hypothetical protein